MFGIDINIDIVNMYNSTVYIVANCLYTPCINPFLIMCCGAIILITCCSIIDLDHVTGEETNEDF